MGVLTHLDGFKDTKALKKTKKTLKHRFWTEIYQGGWAVAEWAGAWSFVHKDQMGRWKNGVQAEACPKHEGRAGNGHWAHACPSLAGWSS